MASFRKVEFTMSRVNGYGQYNIIGKYRGKNITVHTTNSEAWDYLDDDSNKVKQMDAKRHCYNKIVQEYERLYGLT